MKQFTILLTIAMISIIIMIAGCTKQVDKHIQQQKAQEVEEYNPNINPADFTTEITNPYF